MAIDLTGETALVDFLTDAGTLSLSGDINLFGATAQITVRAQSTTSVPVIQLTGGNYELTGLTALISVKSTPGTFVLGSSTGAGDHWLSPTQISGSGTKVWTVTPYTLDTDEPASELSALFYQSRWFQYQGSGNNVTFDISADSTDVYIEIWDASDPTDYSTWGFYDGGTGPVTIDAGLVPATSVLIVRVSTSSNAATFSSTLVYTSTTPTGGGVGGGVTGDLQAEMGDSVLFETPASIVFSLFNAAEAGTVTVGLTGVGTLATFTADDSGVIVDASVLIPALNAGTYNLTFTAGVEATQATLQILNDPVAVPGVTPPDDPAALPGGVHRWILQDPTAVLTQYEFTYNPTTMTSPHGARPFTIDATTAPDGQPQIWEGLPKAIEWEFSGYLDTEADLLAIESYLNLRRRFYLIDHRDRVWVVVFTGFDPQPKRVAMTPYAHTYTVKALLYGEGTGV